MRLLSPKLAYLLPPLGSQNHEPEPFVYGHFMVPDHPWSYYVTEGEWQERDYVFFGFLLGSEEEQDWQWSTERLSGLERLLDGRIVRDDTFTPGPLTEVIILPS